MTEFHLTDIKGVGPAKARLLESHGFTTIAAVAEADSKDLEAVPGIKAMTAAAIQAGARALAGSSDQASVLANWPDVEAPMVMPQLVDTPATMGKKAAKKAKERRKKDKAKAKKLVKAGKKQAKEQEKKQEKHDKKQAKQARKAAEAEGKKKKDKKKTKQDRPAGKQADAAKAESKPGGGKEKKQKKGKQRDEGKPKKSSGKKAKG